MSKRAMDICATMIALTLAGAAVGQTTDTTNPAPTASAGNPGPGAADTGSTSSAPPTTSALSPGQMRVAGKFAAPFVTLAGSRENAAALATALRTGSSATLTYTLIDDSGKATTTTVTITPPTKPMGWGNVSHSLALAQLALNQAGITNPTGAQLQAALMGGNVTTADGKTVALAGVLQQRADGMGWGRIAQSYGTTMGAVNRTTKIPATAVAATTPAAPPKDPPTVTAPGTASGQDGAATQRVTTAGGTSAGAGQNSRGITTAGGTSAGTGQGAKGITTATGAPSSANPSGIVSADGGTHGNGNAYGRGVVTASGGAAGVVAPGAHANGGASNGIVTGTVGAAGVVTADPGNGAGSAKTHGKGKSGG